jgi:glucose dehydrogenase
MTDLLLLVILTGVAVTYVIEFLDMLLDGFMLKPAMNKFLALPLSFLAVWAQRDLDLKFFVLVPASTFVSLAIGMWLNKPTVVQAPRLPRL